jgi:hypothetical protein
MSAVLSPSKGRAVIAHDLMFRNQQQEPADRTVARCQMQNAHYTIDVPDNGLCDRPALGKQAPVWQGSRQAYTEGPTKLKLGPGCRFNGRSQRGWPTEHTLAALMKALHLE